MYIIIGFGRRPSESEIDEQAMTIAAADLPQQIRALGSTPRQAQAITEAMKFVILANENVRRARKAILRADFDSPLAEEWLDVMQQSAK